MIFKRFKRKGLFGSKVIGKERALLEQRHVKERRTRFGPKVLGPEGAKPGTNIPKSQVKLDISKVSVEQIRETLETNPIYFAALLNAEWDRHDAGGIRRGAVELFLEKLDECVANPVERTRVRLRCERFLKTGRDESQDRIAMRAAKQKKRLDGLKQRAKTPADFLNPRLKSKDRDDVPTDAEALADDDEQALRSAPPGKFETDEEDEDFGKEVR